MPRLTTLAALLLAGCQQLPTDAPSSRELLPQLAAVTSTSSTVVPFGMSVFVPCALGGAGEVVVASGNLHILLVTTISDNGNVLNKYHFQPQQLAGVGQTSGASYQGTGVTQQTQTVNGNPPWNVTYVNNFRFIGQGPGNNYTVHTTFHLTVNADGTLTSQVDNTRVDCG